jgi:hypothetical protein
MTFMGERTQEQDQQWVSADPVQATMQQIHEHLPVEIIWSQALQADGADSGHMPAPNFQVGSKVCLDACNIRTTHPTRKLDWKRFGPFRVCRQVSPYEYKLELPASIRIHQVQSVSLLDPGVEDPIVGQDNDSPHTGGGRWR